MATRVNVTSVEAIESFRASLIVYLSKAKPALEEVNGEVVRVRQWVSGSQRVHWEGILKKRARVLEEAKAALFSSRMSNLRDETSSELMAVTKAKRAYDEADEKLRQLKRWDRDFDNQAEPIARQLEKLHTFLSDDISKAIIYLSQTLASLNAYTETIVTGIDDAAAAPAGSDPSSTSGEPKP